MTTPKKTLQRFPKQGQISGVCAGLADYFDLDVTLVRVIFVALAFATGGGMVLLYIILSIIVPSADEVKGEEADEKSDNEHPKSDQDKLNTSVQQLSQDMQDNGGVDTARNYLGLGLVAVGMWLLLSQFFPNIMALRWDYVWPVLLIFIGFVIITKRKG